MPAKKAILSLEPGRHLYLASTSPRRKELLETLALPFTIISPENAEPDPFPDEDPFSFVARAASAKAQAALGRLRLDANDSFILLAADTIVCLDREILEKPNDVPHAFHMLQKLAGREHLVLSSVHMSWSGASAPEEYAFTETTRVLFAAWPDELLWAYAQSQEPLDKAGAYAIQGLGSFLARSIMGSWTNVVGLPLSTLVKKMLDLGLLMPNP